MSDRIMLLKGDETTEQLKGTDGAAHVTEPNSGAIKAAVEAVADLVSDEALAVQEAAPVYEQFDITTLGSAAATVGSPGAVTAISGVWTPCYKMKERTFFAKITGDGTVSIGVDYSPGGGDWYRYGTALGTNLTKTSGNGGYVALSLPADLWGLEIRAWIQNTDGTAVTVAIKAGGRA